MPRTNAERAEHAYRAVLNYEGESSVEECISDLLGDLRHLCDESGYDFAERDQVGYRNYLTELSETPMESEPGAFARRLEDFKAATLALAREWGAERDDEVPDIDDYPRSLPSFDEFAAEVAAMRVAAPRH